MKKASVLLCLLFLNLSAFSQSLQLPFFDDFAKYNNRLDTTKWLPSKGIYVNDRFSTNPASKNVATFNGINAKGALNTRTISSYGQVDTLISRPIDLAQFTPSDSVYLSFSLQLGAFDSYPSVSSTLPRYFRVEFKTPTGWQQALNIPAPASGQRPDFAAFKKFTVPVTNAAYFHNGFQFRFRTAGENTLFEESWNLDYVTLAANSRKGTNTSVDVAASLPLNPVLKRYTAMPVHQFNANPAGELSDSIRTILTNLSPSIRSFDWSAALQFNGNAPVTLVNAQTEQIGAQQFNKVRLAAKLNASDFSGLSGQQEIKSSIYFTNFEPTTETRYNDTVSSITRLHDYYAYDDGSAESVTSVYVGNAGQAAIKYSLNQPDQVKGLSVYIPKANNTQGVSVTFRIWDEDPATGNPSGTGKFSQTFQVPAISQLDNWFSIPVNTPVAVSGNFYVGWLIAANPKAFSVGTDFNNNAPGMTKSFTAANGWVNNTNRGVLMLRPYMSNFIASASDDLQAAIFEIYPNPASNFVTIRGAFETVTLLDATGKTIKMQKGLSEETTLETSGIKPGLYFLRTQTKNGVQTKKLIIRN